MAHEALARKYRPRTFEEMVGQEAVVRTLTNALKSRKIHPAYIFSGIRGVGKTTAARLFAKGLNCEKGPTAVPCNECASCLEIAAARSMDVLEIDGATNTKAEEARDLMQAARYMPVRDRFRVFIIDEVHMLSTAAFNALLKTLEEPPPHAIFLLATTEPHKIPETIHSRAQHFQFRRVTEAQVVRHLEAVCQSEGVQVDPAALRLVARSGEGSVRDGLTLLDRLMAYADGPVTEALAVEVLGVVGREALLGLLDLLAAGDAGGVPAFVDGLRERGQSLERFLSDFTELTRDALRIRVAGEEAPGDDPHLARVASRFSLEDLLRLWDLLVATQQRMKGAPDPDALLELQLVKAALLPKILPLDQLLAGAAIAAPASEPPSIRSEASQPAGPSRPMAKADSPDPQEATEEAGDGLRFRALIPFQRMDEHEAHSYEAEDERSERFREEASHRLPLAGPALSTARISLDPEGTVHVALPATAATAAALLNSKERKHQLEEVARQLGLAGSVLIETGEAGPAEPARTGPGAPEEEHGQAVGRVMKILGGQVQKVTPVALEPPAGGTDAEPE
ncbi:MAG: DNA polymerase III subunit gamma/tau [Acidobacteriota bacterium]